MENFDNEKVFNHLSVKWQKRKCPMCKTRNWGVSDAIYELKGFKEVGHVPGNIPIIPVIPVTCENCGNTILVNAIAADIVKPKIAEKNDQ